MNQNASDIKNEFKHDTKSSGAFRTISEVSLELDVPQHVLRFWESRFTQIKPLKMRGGRRYYRPEDVTVLRRIKTLLYSQGYTIKGAKKVFDLNPVRNESTVQQKPVASALPAAPEQTLARVSEKLISNLERASHSVRTQHKDELKDILKDLYSMREMLKKMVD